MATSYPDQIPVVVYLLQQLRPRTILDVGKGFGKYGFLAHEYAGIDPASRVDPKKTMAEQSRLVLDAVEIEPALLLPHLTHLYRTVFSGDIAQLCDSLPSYDVVLMADVIEHMHAPAARKTVRTFLDRGSNVIVTTPKRFFTQACYESEFEAHVSHWGRRDFDFASYVDHQPIGPGRVFLLSNSPIRIRGFGSRPMTRIRRLARIVRDQFI